MNDASLGFFPLVRTPVQTSSRYGDGDPIPFFVLRNLNQALLAVSNIGHAEACTIWLHH